MVNFVEVRNYLCNMWLETLNKTVIKLTQLTYETINSHRFFDESIGKKRVSCFEMLLKIR